jgi:hypothetical protein
MKEKPLIDFKTVTTRLEENDLKYEVIDLGSDAKIIVSAYGGRIFGPFINDGDSMCWINPCFASAEAFKTFLDKKEWNLGGDRIWLAPEMQYNVPDKDDFWGSYKVPNTLDPGNYAFDKGNKHHVTLKQKMNLEVYGSKKKQKKLSISRTISRIKDSFKDFDIIDGLSFGYDHEIHLKEKVSDGIFSEAWDLLQINPEGTLYIPTTASAQYSEYYEPLKQGYQKINDHYVELKIDAKSQYKVGYKSAITTGKSGYVSKYGKKDYLMIRSFYNDPLGPYVKSPTGEIKDGGHALHVYNDDGNIGNFAEHECSCLPIGADTGRSQSIDRISTMFFVGSKAYIKSMMKLLLGID